MHQSKYVIVFKQIDLKKMESVRHRTAHTFTDAQQGLNHCGLFGGIGQYCYQLPSGYTPGQGTYPTDVPVHKCTDMTEQGGHCRMP